MTTYKEIFGKYVKNYSSDPSSDIEGQIWYNSTSGTFKTAVTNTGTWSSGGNLNTARFVLAGAGTQTAAVAFGGQPTPNTNTNATEKYDGSTWTTSGNMNTPRGTLAGCGSQTAALGFGGYATPGGNTAATEKFNGSTWTSVNNMGTARYFLGGCGIQTAALAAGGWQPGVASVTNVEKYDGTNWTASTALPGARSGVTLAGTQTAALLWGNNYFGGNATSLKFDGTTWTDGGFMTVPSINRAGGAGSDFSRQIFLRRAISHTSKSSSRFMRPAVQRYTVP